MARAGQSLAFEDDFLATEATPDADFDAFIMTMGRSPGKGPMPAPVPDSVWGYGAPEGALGPHGDFYPCTATTPELADQSWSACFDLPADSSASTGVKRRKVSDLDDVGLLCAPLELPPLPIQPEAQDNTEIPRLPLMIPTSPKAQTEVTPVKRCKSPFTVEPFSVVKKFPGMEGTMSLADVNHKIQLFAGADTAYSSSSSQSSCSFPVASTPPRIRFERGGFPSERRSQDSLQASHSRGSL